ncbi:hypothetical protein Csa_016749 [Cucumis sativus]|uniref:S1 motif domain-containing protein n=1 Tax=Cucumis sativus TaxID=3659 RepID=A0A0A0K811_CUCSA|nr:hypothetical protein Csa_016749 [Cucumis sativus]
MKSKGPWASSLIAVHRFLVVVSPNTKGNSSLFTLPSLSFPSPSLSIYIFFCKCHFLIFELSPTLSTMASHSSNLECRIYEAKYPEVDMVVMIQVKNIADMGAYVSLLEYNNIEGIGKKIRRLHLTCFYEFYWKL